MTRQSSAAGDGNERLWTVALFLQDKCDGCGVHVCTSTQVSRPTHTRGTPVRLRARRLLATELRFSLLPQPGWCISAPGGGCQN
ncbi:hypothetical protein J6590_074079 [Homalodisca vitripennis]|nr:hypothetical protein J6590_074079 [Homalodisca vitripennis]